MIKLFLLPLMVFFFFSCENLEDDNSSSSATEKNLYGTWISSNYSNSIVLTSNEIVSRLTPTVFQTFWTANAAFKNAVKSTNIVISIVDTAESQIITLDSAKKITLKRVNSITKFFTNNNPFPLPPITSATSSISGTFTFTDTTLVYALDLSNASGIFATEFGTNGTIPLTYVLSADKNTLNISYVDLTAGSTNTASFTRKQ